LREIEKLREMKAATPQKNSSPVKRISHSVFQSGNSKNATPSSI